MGMSEMTLHCKQCSYEWRPQIRLPIPISRFVAAARGIVAAGCPSCGATGRNVMCGPAPKADVSQRQFSKAHP